MLRKSMLLAVMFVLVMAVSAFGADKLIVQNSSSVTQFVVTDTGLVGFGQSAPSEFVDVIGDSTSTNVRLTKFGGNPGAVFRAAQGTLASPSQVLANGVLGGFVAAGYTSGGAFSSNKVGIYFLASENFTTSAQGTSLRIDTTAAGSTTKATKATFNDAGLTIVGTYSQSSSRSLKDNIETLPVNKAKDTLKNLEPVTFNYKFDKEQQHVGFIAEDVPDLVAAKDRKSLSSMDIVAVLTKVVKEQDKQIETLSATVSRLESELNKLKK